MALGLPRHDAQGVQGSARGECYLVERAAARRAARMRLSTLELLIFEARKDPTTRSGVAYCAAYSRKYLRILSVDEGLVNGSMRQTFASAVLPWILKRLAGFKRDGYDWPCVAVVLDTEFLEVTCSVWGEFPDTDEIRAKSNAGRSFIASATTR